MAVDRRSSLGQGIVLALSLAAGLAMVFLVFQAQSFVDRRFDPYSLLVEPTGGLRIW